MKLILIPLWIALCVLSLGALTVVTGRHPRPIVDLRHAVEPASGYYAYNALGTDHYPPFAESLSVVKGRQQAGSRS